MGHGVGFRVWGFRGSFGLRVRSTLVGFEGPVGSGPRNSERKRCLNFTDIFTPVLEKNTSNFFEIKDSNSLNNNNKKKKNTNKNKKKNNNNSRLRPSS